MTVSITASQRRRLLVTVSTLSVLMAAPAWAQQAGQDPGQGNTTELETIVVTAQRQAESLQDVPIAVSAFGAEQLERQQISTTTALQYALPNVTFTKGNFSGSNLTIRGIGAPVVATSSDGGVGIHINEMPLVDPRIFEIEFFDMERIEVLRGPQGTLFGRNATGGVVNFITKKPTDEFESAAELEYGNYDALRVQGMINVPLGERAGVRLAGIYVNREGYTTNLFDNSKIDGRDSFAFRGSFRFKPGENTTIDLMASHFREDSNRSRIQKQLCARDSTAIIGCRPDQLGFETLNANATLAGITNSREFFGLAFGAPGGGWPTRVGASPGFVLGTVNSISPGGALRILGGAPTAVDLAALGQAQGLLAGLAASSVYGPDAYAGAVNPADVRTVNTDFNPTYRSRETVAMFTLNHDFEMASIRVNAGYAKGSVDSRTDYNISVGARPPASQIATMQALFPQSAARLYGPAVNGLPTLNVSEADRNYTGWIGGRINRSTVAPTEYDRSQASNRQYFGELLVTSQLDGPLNGKFGVSYLDNKGNSDYFVTSNGLDFATAVLGAGQGLASPFFNNEVDTYRLKASAVFGELEYQVSDSLKLTAGLRYTIDKKSVLDRQLLFNAPVPLGTTDFNPVLAQIVGAGLRNTASDLCGRFTAPTSPITATQVPVNPALCPFVYDADGNTAGAQGDRASDVEFKRLTGRFVIDWKPILSFTDDTLVYASYSRGYKSGGINPGFDPTQFTAPTAFEPETINAFEVGTKNRFADGTVQLNMSAFYYDYKGLQVSRIINRTSFNDNTDATVWGLELETLFQPAPDFLINASMSYLKTKIKDLTIPDSRDPSAGRNDVVIIKDITNASNCVVRPVAAGVPRADALVNGVNAGVSGQLGPILGAAYNPTTNPILRGVTPVPGTNTVGAFSICQALASTIAAQGLPYEITLPVSVGGVAVTRTPTANGFAPITDPAVLARVGLPDGVPVDLSGNELQNSPNWKFAIGAQYTFTFENEWTLTPRIDYNYTGSFWGRNFNSPVDKISGFDIINAQITAVSPDGRFTVRAFVQNIENDQGLTGMYVTDPSSGMFTNIFTTEPRRYGVALGLKF
jgi:iron complex outermembrane recepter protein